jgi:hypothetical protein
MFRDEHQSTQPFAQRSTLAHGIQRAGQIRHPQGSPSRTSIKNGVCQAVMDHGGSQEHIDNTRLVVEERSYWTASTDFKKHCPCSVLRIWRSTAHLRQVNSCLRTPETWTWSSHGTPISAGTAKVAFLGISPRGRLVQVRRIMSDLLTLLHKTTGKAG